MEQLGGIVSPDLVGGLMAYNGREVLKGIAYDNDWYVTNHELGDSGDTLVKYRRNGTLIVIVWSPENTAKAVVRTSDSTTDEEYGRPPLSLIQARSWIEEKG